MYRIALFIIFASSTLGAQDVLTIYAPNDTPHSTKLSTYLKKEIIHGNAVECKFPDMLSDDTIKIETHHTFGQEKEMQALADMITKYRDTYGIQRFIIFGISRGAAAALNFVKNLSEYGIKPEQIQALILESIYTDIPRMLSNLENVRQYTLLGLRTTTPIRHALTFASLCHKKNKHTRIRLAEEQLVDITSYNPTGIQPIDHLERVPKELPIFFVNSLQDEQISAEETYDNFYKLKTHGHQYAYFYQLAAGQHDQYTDIDRNYRPAVHAFLKKHNLPHNPRYAAFGEQHLQDA
jgi:pimeloyl-ACP methyl ester carboxylesterase